MVGKHCPRFRLRHLACEHAMSICEDCYLSNLARKGALQAKSMELESILIGCKLLSYRTPEVIIYFDTQGSHIRRAPGERKRSPISHLIEFEHASWSVVVLIWDRDKNFSIPCWTFNTRTTFRDVIKVKNKCSEVFWCDTLHHRENWVIDTVPEDSQDNPSYELKLNRERLLVGWEGELKKPKY